MPFKNGFDALNLERFKTHHHIQNSEIWARIDSFALCFMLQFEVLDLTLYDDGSSNKTAAQVLLGQLQVERQSSTRELILHLLLLLPFLQQKG